MFWYKIHIKNHPCSHPNYCLLGPWSKHKVVCKSSSTPISLWKRPCNPDWFSAFFQRNLCNFSCMVNNWAHTTLEESNKSLINLDSRTLFYLHHYSSKRIFSSLSRNVTCFLKQLFSVNLIYIYSSSSECYSNIVKKHIWKNYRII